MLFIKNVLGNLSFVAFLIASLISFPVLAQTKNCNEMAGMARDVVNLRDRGVPLSAIENRLNQDVKDQAELTLALVAVRMAYDVRGNGQQVEKAVLDACRKQGQKSKR